MEAVCHEQRSPASADTADVPLCEEGAGGSTEPPTTASNAALTATQVGSESHHSQPSSTSPSPDGLPRCRLVGRLPITGLLCSVAAVVVYAIVVCVFVIVISMIQVNVFDVAQRFAATASDRASATVDRHFTLVRRAGDFTSLAVNRENFLSDFPNASRYVTAFAQFAVENNVHIVASTTTSAGSQSFGVASYALANASGYPQKPGLAVVQIATGAWNHVLIQYADIYSGEPVGATLPTWKPFNFSARPYASLFYQRKAWSTVFISSLTSTAAIGYGGPFFDLSTGNLLGAFALLDFTVDVAKSLKTIPVAKTGRLVLVDAASTSYLAGNIDDNVVAMPPLVTSPRLLLLNELQDPVIADLARIEFKSLLECATTCKWVFETAKKRLSTYPSGVIFIVDDFLLVHVSTVRDNVGLHLKVIIAIPISDFTQQYRDSLTFAVIATFGIATVLLLIAGFIVRILLMPLHDAELLITDVLDVVQRHKLTYYNHVRGCESGIKTCRNVVELREVYAVLKAATRLRTEIDVYQSFLANATIGTTTRTGGDDTRATRDDSFRSELTDGTHTQVVDLDDAASFSSGCTALLPHFGSDTATLNISFVSVDLDRFDEFRRTLLPSVLDERHSAYIRTCVTVAQQHKGVVSFFYGDRVYAHFNAKRRCKRHASEAVLAALSIASEVNKMGVLPRVRIGVSTSEAICGTVGPAVMRRFQVFGRCVDQAIALTRELHSETIPVLCSWHTMRCINARSNGSWIGNDVLRPGWVPPSSDTPNSGAVLFRHRLLVSLPYEVRTTIVSQPVRYYITRANPLNSSPSEEGCNLDAPVYVNRDNGTVAAVTELNEARRLIAVSNQAYEQAAAGDIASTIRLLEYHADRVSFRSLFPPEDCWLTHTLFAAVTQQLNEKM